MKIITYSLFVALLFTSSISYSKTLHTIPIAYAYETSQDMKRIADFVAEGKRSTRDIRMVKESTAQALIDTQRLYHQMNDLRYKAQLTQEKWAFKGICAIICKNLSSWYLAARAAQVHWKDLANAASSRLSTEKSNDRKLFSHAEDAERAKARLSWTRTFRSYTSAVHALVANEYNDMHGRYEAEANRTYALANAQVKEAEAESLRASKKAESVTESFIIKELRDKKTEADEYYLSVVNAHHKFNADNVLSEELLPEPWNMEEERFNYNVPCTLDNTLGVAIVIHDEDKKDLLEQNEAGDLVYDKGVAMVYDQMLGMCLVIMQPKNGLSASVTDWGEETHYRHWVSVGHGARTESEEINDAIDLIHIATFRYHNAPIYLVEGHDSGNLAYKVTKKLKASKAIKLITGILTVNPRTKELTLTDSKGNVSQGDNVQPAMGMLKVKYIMNKHVKGNVMLN